MSKLKLNKDYLLTFVLIIVLTILFLLNIKFTGSSSVFLPKNINYNDATNTLNISSLTLRQKISQTIVVYGDEKNIKFIQRNFFGGIYLDIKPSKEEYINTINNFQKDSIVPLFVTVDMEGCWNPFDRFQQFPTFKEIKTDEDAYQLGKDHGKLLKELGFNLNFAPVVDLNDTIWICRSFPGNSKEISMKSNKYIDGLREFGILSTSKHYPGKTLVHRDPHKLLSYATIEDEDLIPFKETIKNNVTGIMISHTIVNGSVNSENKPSVVSRKLVENLREDFNGLIITDEIRMLGLRDYYGEVDDLYLDLYLADNDVILNFDLQTEVIDHMIDVIEDGVRDGKLSEERIDRSVIRILEAKKINWTM